MRIANTFEPDLVLVSAGFDAAPGDPLGPGFFLGKMPWGFEEQQRTVLVQVLKAQKHELKNFRILHGDILDIEWSYEKD